MRNTSITFFILGLLFWQNAVFGQFAEVPSKTNLNTQKVDLSGSWLFNTTPNPTFWKSKNIPASSSPITVPGEWTMQGFDVKPGKTAAYFRTFEVPIEWDNYTIYLHCDAVFSQADVWINGKTAGTHVDPLVAFQKDITNLVNPGKSNRIVLGITAETMADTLMSGTQYAAHQLGGILRKIYLFAVPKTHLTNLVVETHLDHNYEDADLKISALLKNKDKKKNAELNVRLYDASGKEINLKNNRQQVTLSKHSDKPVSFSINVKNPLKWDAEHPNLYNLKLELISNDESEIISKQIGFRQIEVVGNQLYVNGKTVKLKGVNRHEVHPLKGRSLTPELWQKDAELFKAANVNYIRTSHYPPSEEFIKWCDKIGLYVELENPICWVGHHANKYWVNNDPTRSDLYPYFEQTSRKNIAFFRNHPSIIIWSMANESRWTENWSKLADLYASEDSTRPASFHDQGYGGFNNYGSTKMPIANIHYPGTAGPSVAENFDRPLLFGEYAHLNTYNRVEIVTDPGVRDAWGRGFKKMWEGMYKSRGCLGGAIWSGIDDVFYLPDGRTVGYGEWGPIDGWRREKPEYYHMKKSYSPVKVHNRQIPVPNKGQGIQLQVENRFDFTNLNECIINWILEDEKGTVRMSLDPHQSGILTIHPASTTLAGKILNITFTSPQGVEVEACAIEIGNVKRDNFPFVKVSSASLNTKKQDQLLSIIGDGFNWSFDLSSGKIKEASVNNEVVLNGGADLMMLDLTTGECNTEHSLDIPLHNDLCSNWKKHSSAWVSQNDTIIVKVMGEYDQANGEIEYRFSEDGKVTIKYLFHSRIDMNPRQWGMVLTASAETKHLKWYRKGLWSWYPDNHIGRTMGEAIPFGEKAFRLESFGQQPEDDWKYDANQLGTNDFRATRENIYWAVLTNAKGKGVTLLSNGKQAFRSFVNGDKSISFLVADYSTGGGDLFFSGHYSSERRKLKKGSSIEGVITLQLVKNFK
jgi:hypothetical protein